MNKRIKLKELSLNITDGKHGDCVNQDDSGYYFISVKDIRDYGIDYKNARQITKQDFVEVNKRTKLEEGDVLLANSGHTIGKILFVKASPLVLKTTFQKSVAVLKPNGKIIDPHYYFYLLKTYVKSFKKAAVGSAQPNLLLNDLREFEVQIHEDILIQRRIALVLSSLDAKIELNNRINSELEQMAKTLYDYWFVQFDFPDEEGKPYKSSGGKMVYNEELKREIPEGWEIQPLAQWINKDKGGDWGKESEQGNYTEKVNCIRGADINGLIGKGELKSPKRYILEKNTSKILRTNDLIIEISGGSPSQSTGRLAHITKGTLERFNNPIICSNFCKAINLKDDNQVYYFVYYWNLIYENNFLFGWEGKTSGIKNLLFDSFVSHYKIPSPDKSIIEKFNAFIRPVEAKRQKNLKENQHLASLRDWLLPMLMNGQVTVKEAKEQMDMAAEPEAGYNSKN